MVGASSMGTFCYVLLWLRRDDDDAMATNMIGQGT